MASRRKIKPDQLGEVIGEILAEYGDEIEDNIKIITKKIGQKGAQALRNESKEKFPKGTGKYAKGWTATEVKYPHYTSVVLHNKTPGLPHLLEHGHALIRGGRQVGTVKGREHIAPVEGNLITEYQREVIAKL